MRLERSRMDAIDASLVITGNDSIKDLYEFIADREQKAREANSYSDWIMYSRILTELSLAIVSFAGSKARKEK